MSVIYIVCKGCKLKFIVLYFQHFSFPITIFFIFFSKEARAELCPDDAFFRSINRMPHVESRMRNATHSSYCSLDESLFSRLPLDGINLLGKTFRLWGTNVA